MKEIKPPNIPEDEHTPVVRELLHIIEEQGLIIRAQSEQIQLLRDEIARLTKRPPKPDIKPSGLGKNRRKKKKKAKAKRPGSDKERKTETLKIDDTQVIEPEHVPPGSRFIDYKEFVVQNIKLESCNICYKLKVYQAPDGTYVKGVLPAHLNNGHFGPELICFILYQHYHCQVTQPLLLEQLDELGIRISKGQLNNILIENKDRYHREKEDILAVGLEVSHYVNVDDTGARHKGKNGYCTHIGNEAFSWFESTESKSRINFLRLLRTGYSDFVINTDAIAYMTENKLPQNILKPIMADLGKVFGDDRQWNDFLDQSGIVSDRHVQIATEGVLIGSIIEHGIPKHLVIVSDDAGQFNVLLHALCWIHANRAIDKIIPYTEQAEKDLNRVKDDIWHLYKGLKAYKENPNIKDKKRLNDRFDKIVTQTTASATLNNALKRIYNNKSELLLVLERPDIPLHNNSAENAIREYVKKRKISGSTRSESGRKCRDTFTSLKKTCRKLGLTFWQYLKDRILLTGTVPQLSDLIRQQAMRPG